MADKELDEDVKKPGDGENAAQDQEIQEKDVSEEEGVEAEDAILQFVRGRIEDFSKEMESACDAFEAWAMSQPPEFQTVFNQRGFYDFLGDNFERGLLDIVGGAGSPLMDAFVGEVHGAVSFAQHSSSDLSGFINNAMRRSTRDAAWFLRDSVQGLLGSQWKELLALARDGGDQFIPAIYQLGLPSRAFHPQEFADSLKAQAEAYRSSMGVQQKDVTQDVQQQDPQKQAEIEEQAQQDMLQEQDTKEQMA